MRAEPASFSQFVSVMVFWGGKTQPLAGGPDLAAIPASGQNLIVSNYRYRYG